MNVHHLKPLAPKFLGGRPTLMPVPPQRSIVTQGDASIEVQPDTMTMTLSLEEKTLSYKSTADLLLPKAKKLTEAVKALAIPGLQMQSGVSISKLEEYDYNTRKNIFQGYQGRFNLSVTEQGGDSLQFADHASKLSTVAETNRASFHGPQFSLSPDKTRDVQIEANAKAYLNAKANAQAIANAAGMTLESDPLEVKLGHVASYQPRGLQTEGLAMAAMADAGPSTSSSPAIYEFKPIPVTSQFLQAAFALHKKA